MNHPKPKKNSIDWYFPRVNGRIALPDAKQQKNHHALNTPHVENGNVEARHRAVWRRHLRPFFGALLAGLFAASVLDAAETAAPLVQPVKSSMKAAKKAAPTPAKAEKVYPKEAKKTERTVSGTVTGVRKNQISVEFALSEEAGGEEMLIPFGTGLKLANVKSVKDIAYGDLVEVKFLQIVMPSKIKGGDPAVLDTRALEIRLVERAADRVLAAAASTEVPA